MAALRLLFWPHGRIGREQYLLGLAVLLFLFSIAVTAARSMGESDAMAAVAIAMIPLLALAPWMFAVLAMKRLHDLGFGGLWCLTLLVPALNFIVALMLLFLSGQPYDNRYGPGLEGPAPEPDAAVAPPRVEKA